MTESDAPQTVPHGRPSYSLEFYPTNPPRPAAIWRGKPADNSLVAILKGTSCTMEEAQAMHASLKEMVNRV